MANSFNKQRLSPRLNLVASASTTSSILPPARAQQPGRGASLNAHLLALFFRVSMSSLRNRKPSWWAVWLGTWGTDGVVWAGADRDLTQTLRCSRTHPTTVC